MVRADRNCIAYWSERLVTEAAVPVPKTEINNLSAQAREEIYGVFDGEQLGEDALRFIERLKDGGGRLGWPVFLRTGHMSGKHDWKRTCFVERAQDMESHVIALVEASEMAGIVGLPVSVWAVREFLPTQPVGVCPGYGDMPVCREFRAFIKDGQQVCRHPYWPLEALREGCFVSNHGHSLENAYEILSHIRDGEEFDDIVRRVAGAFDGAWSVDLLDTTEGWYVIDMAQAHQSWHWPGCTAAELMYPSDFEENVA